MTTEGGAEVDLLTVTVPTGLLLPRVLAGGGGGAAVPVGEALWLVDGGGDTLPRLLLAGHTVTISVVVVVHGVPELAGQ